jgi:hypothetical protein
VSAVAYNTFMRVGCRCPCCRVAVVRCQIRAGITLTVDPKESSGHTTPCLCTRSLCPQQCLLASQCFLRGLTLTAAALGQPLEVARLASHLSSRVADVGQNLARDLVGHAANLML